MGRRDDARAHGARVRSQLARAARRAGDPVYALNALALDALSAGEVETGRRDLRPRAPRRRRGCTASAGWSSTAPTASRRSRALGRDRRRVPGARGASPTGPAAARWALRRAGALPRAAGRQVRRAPLRDARSRTTSTTASRSRRRAPSSPTASACAATAGGPTPASSSARRSTSSSASARKPWAERARVELRATGGAAAEAGAAEKEAVAAAGLDELTAHELQIARLVAYGHDQPRGRGEALPVARRPSSTTCRRSTASSTCARARSWRA